MLILKHLTIQDSKNHTLLNDLNYSLGNDDKVGIIGEEGNGKSTLLKAIYNRNLIEDYAAVSGIIDTDYKEIGYFEQQLSSTWEDAFLFEYLLKEDSEDEIQPEQFNDLQGCETLCAELGLKNEILYGEQKIGTLSGGEKVKLQLLKLMLRKPELLLLDEPTNDLDIQTLQWLEGFLKNLRIPVLFISHDEILLSRCANVILHLEQLNKKTQCRHTVYRGNYEEYVEQRSNRLKKEAQEASWQKREYRRKKEKLNDFINAVHDAQNDTVRSPFYAAALKTKMRNLKAQDRRLEKEGYAHVDSVEEAIDVFFEGEGFPKSRRILDFHQEELKTEKRVLLKDIHITLYGRQKTVIAGENGSGKSLLMKEIYNILKTHTDIRLGYMPQNYAEAFSEQDTPVTFLLEACDRDDVTRARELLGRMKFTREEMEHPVYQLSEGQKAKLYLLRFIKQGCNVLLLDEPTRNLSPLTSPVIRRILKDFPGCILAVSHDRLFIQEVFDSVLWISHNKLQELETERFMEELS